MYSDVYDPYLFLEISEKKKNTEYLTLALIMQRKCHKVYEGYIELNSTQRRKHKKTKN